jgi:hypothetical protein
MEHVDIWRDGSPSVVMYSAFPTHHHSLACNFVLFVRFHEMIILVYCEPSEKLINFFVMIIGRGCNIGGCNPIHHGFNA